MKLIFCCFCLLLTSLAQATIKITTFGYHHGIVADTNEWICSESSDSYSQNKTSVLKNSLQKAASNTNVSNNFIHGKSTAIPLTFYLFHAAFRVSNLYSMEQRVHSFLSHYSISTSSVISNVNIKEIKTDSNEVYYIVDGCFFDNTSIGYFSILIEGVYVMFVELRTDIFDKQTREVIMSKPFDLITPLYNP